MITKEKLDEITQYLMEHIFRNDDVMFNEGMYDRKGNYREGDFGDLPDIIASLHNYLYEAVTGSRYDYWFHWVNKIGAGVDEDFFNPDSVWKDDD